MSSSSGVATSVSELLYPCYFTLPSAGVAVTPCNGITKVQCNRALIMRRLASQLYVGIAAVVVATRLSRSAGCRRCNALVKVDRAVYGCVDLNDQDRIRSSRRFDSNPIYQDRIRSEFSTRIVRTLIDSQTSPKQPLQFARVAFFCSWDALPDAQLTASKHF